MSLSEWDTLGDVPYRKVTVYDSMAWGDGMLLEDFTVCGAPFGGPVAMIKDELRVVPPGGGGGSGTGRVAAAAAAAFPPSGDKATLFLYTSAGYKLAEVDWEQNNRRVAGMGWSDREELLVVLEDGNVYVYDILGKLVYNFLLVDLTTSANVVECLFWGDGVAAITADMQVFVADGVACMDATLAPRKYRMPSGLTANKPHTAAALIPPLLSRSGVLEVLLGAAERTIVVVDENGFADQRLQDKLSAPVTKMSVAPNGRFLACYCRDGMLTVMSTTFTSKVLDFDTKAGSRPQEMAWCGDDAVVMVWRSSGIVMVGPYGDYLNFPYEHAITGTRLVPEPDCCRVLTGNSCEVLQRVPACTEAIRRIGSTDPAALMYDAMEAFEEGDPKADESIRSIAADR
jgi:hypothetical protein